MSELKVTLQAESGDKWEIIGTREDVLAALNQFCTAVLGEAVPAPRAAKPAAATGGGKRRPWTGDDDTELTRLVREEAVTIGAAAKRMGRAGSIAHKAAKRLGLKRGAA